MLLAPKKRATKLKRYVALSILIVMAVPIVISIRTQFRNRSGLRIVVGAFQRLPSDRIASAIQGVHRDAQATNKVVPATVTFLDLVLRGYLSAQETEGLPPNARLHTPTDEAESHPELVIAEARLSTGLIVAFLADGSIQQFTVDRLAELIKQHRARAEDRQKR